MSEICFDKETFNMYLFLLFCIIVFLFYTSREQFSTVDLNSNLTKDQLLIKITDLQQELFNTKLNNQLCQKELQIKTQQTGSNSQNRFLDIIYNPLKSPEQINQNGDFYNKGFNANIQNQMMGYITNGNGDQYPIYGRNYNNKNDKFQYFTNDGSRNKIKINVPTKNYEELYDGDSVSISELGGNFIFKKYEQEKIIYDPNVIY